MTISQSVKIVSALVVASGKILLLQRDNNPGIRDPGCWQLPGGGVEDGETPDNAIKRELQEEIGIIPSSICFLTSPSSEIRAYHVSLTDEEAMRVKKGDEGKDLRFFSFDELSSIPLTQKLKKAIQNDTNIFWSLIK